MKFKYYLRGIGIGIIFASIILLVAYHENSPSSLSDDEIIERAKQLGMVEANDPINKIIDNKQSEASTEENQEEAVSTETISTEEAVSTEAVSTEEVNENKAETDLTETSTELEDTASNDDSSTDNSALSDNTDNSNNSGNETVEITIDRGSSSYPVCQKLQELGVIDNASEFDDYLIENGYASRISVGTHKINKGMDYKTIAELISDPMD